MPWRLVPLVSVACSGLLASIAADETFTSTSLWADASRRKSALSDSQPPNFRPWAAAIACSENRVAKQERRVPYSIVRELKQMS